MADEIDDEVDGGDLRAPFPFFGGKSRAASLIWERFGDVPNYVEPFAGSLAVLLSRPHDPGIETVNDIDHFIANFWRAVTHDPDAVAHHADWPVLETDLQARHQWLVSVGRERLEKLLIDPDAFDANIAGWWVWGACCWIGSEWCSGEGPWIRGEDGWELGNAGRGVNRKLPHLGDAGRGIQEYMRRLCVRLRRVRVACGDWSRVLTPSPTFRLGMTGIILDPPYGTGDVDYAGGGNRCTGISDAVREWAVANGENPLLRICLCGYDGQFEMPATWSVAEWKAAGGYAFTAAQDTQGKLNRHRERCWFSPACLQPAQGVLWIVK